MEARADLRQLLALNRHWYAAVKPHFYATVRVHCIDQLFRLVRDGGENLHLVKCLQSHSPLRTAGDDIFLTHKLAHLPNLTELRLQPPVSEAVVDEGDDNAEDENEQALLPENVPRLGRFLSPNTFRKLSVFEPSQFHQMAAFCMNAMAASRRTLILNLRVLDLGPRAVAYFQASGSILQRLSMAAEPTWILPATLIFRHGKRFEVADFLHFFAEQDAVQYVSTLVIDHGFDTHDFDILMWTRLLPHLRRLTLFRCALNKNVGTFVDEVQKCIAHAAGWRAGL